MMSRGGFSAEFLMNQTIDEIFEIYDDLKGTDNG